jgi:L-gulonate 3-dehydrogenase
MERIGIVGFGLIGRAWAVVFARAGHDVTVHDAEPAALHAGLGWIDTALADLAAAGLLADEPATVRARIRPASSLEDAVAGADYVQESAGETLDIKRQLFAALDRLAPRDAILASSTSTIPASMFSGELAGRARCLVVHPVNPVHLIPVVELAPAPWTSSGVIARTVDLQRRIGQSPVVLVREIQGFILNRLQAALLCEAITLWDAGIASADDIDRTVRDGLGLRWSFMGPLETFDLAAPGGVVDAAARYGGPFLEIAVSQTATPWTPERMALLAAEREESRTQSSPGTTAERARWRDGRLMGLLAHKRAAAERDPT